MKKTALAKQALLMAMVLSFIFFDGRHFFLETSAEEAVPAAAEEAVDQEKVENIEEKIDKYEDKYKDTEKELKTAQTQLQKTQAAISTTKSLIQKTETDMKRKGQEIADLEKRLQLNKKMLESYIQELYIDDQDPTLPIFLSDGNFDTLVDNFDQMIGIKEKIMAVMEDIRETKGDVEEAKIELAEKKEDHEKLFNVQKGQQVEIQTDISQARATMAELDEKIDKLRGELSSLLGSSVSAKNIKDAASFAAKVTGIRKDYLLGVLVVESNLGRYTGGCNFKESKMSGSRATIFQDICEELDYDYKKQKVSCPPSGYKGTGGAMGVAQFMPDTWKGYKSDIASVTGHNPPDPWNLTDGVVAMALKLTKVDGVKQHKSSAEAKAYCVYLAGGNWASYCDSKGVNYGAKVLYWADNYEKVMN